MASFLASMLPGLLSANQNTGSNVGGNIISSLKDSAGQILNDLGSGKVNSWTDFGKSLARGASNLLGFKPPHNAADRIDSQMAGAGNGGSLNAADSQPIMSKKINDIYTPTKLVLPTTHHNTPHITVGRMENTPAGAPSGNPSIVSFAVKKGGKKKKAKKSKKSSK